ncbi:MAG: ATP-binding cassette domain-containing protein [Clostridiales bacterium]|nr:ATP-binding cassette domain-containing protein [Clostridiales bacterium]
MIIKVDSLCKHYKTYKRGSGLKQATKSLFKREKVVVKAVDDVSFTVNEGEICGILGPNGAGKSTAIKMLCGALFQTSGSIDVMGYNPAVDRKKYVNNIGAVFGQKSQLIWDIPPIDSFRMNKAIYGISDDEYKKNLDYLSELFGVQEIMKKPTRVLSLGERMKCEFIMSMLHNPKIVFLDEPTIGLDVIAKANVRQFIKQINKKGTTFILTTHDLEDVEQLADRTIIINDGKKVFDDTLTNLKHNLGDKKLIELILTKPLTNEQKSDLNIVEEKSQREITIEVDLNKKDIRSFISELSKMVEFSDISVKELPMEQIITQIYSNTL